MERKSASPVAKFDGRKRSVELISPAKGQDPPSATSGFQKNGRAWFVATELQSDLQVEVDNTHFHLHKFPLLSRSGLLNRLVFESRDTEKDHIKLVGLPGGAETFELAAKFCYGVAVEVTPANVAALRCAAEFLEMKDDLEQGNLVTKAEAFMSFSVLASWKDSIAVLRSCKKLLPWAENLQIVQRCIESVAWKACTDPKGIRWSYTGTEDAAAAAAGAKHSSPLFSQSSPRVSSEETDSKVAPQDWWFEDVCLLSVDYFVRTVNAIKAKGMRADLVGAVVTRYAVKWLPGLLKVPKDVDDGSSFKGFDPVVAGRLSCGDETVSGDGSDLHSSLLDMTTEGAPEPRAFLESILGILPVQKDALSLNFQLQLLRAANALQVDPAHTAELERRVASQLDCVSVQDLLLSTASSSDPSSYICESSVAVDVDMICRMTRSFFLSETASEGLAPKSPSMTPLQAVLTTSAKLKVAKVLDAYLAEMANDPKLPLQSFKALVEVLPGSVRLSHDGIYKAVDNFLKAHPDLDDEERKRLCAGIDVQKLSLDSCMHASQNDRLPLRTIVQVLFSEHLKLRNAIIGGGASQPLSEERTPLHLLMQFARVSTSDSDPQSSRDFWSLPHTTATTMDIRALQAEVQQMKAEFVGLKRYCSGLQQQLDGKATAKKNRKGFFSWGSSGLRKFNSKFKSISFSGGSNTSARRAVVAEAPLPPTPRTAAASFDAAVDKNGSRWRRNSVS